MITLKFFTNCFYHVYNRGVEGRDVFLKDRDYLRFIHSLYEFNDKYFALPRRINRGTVRPRQPLVNILCFCLMPNHFHLILQQIRDMGIAKFMQKLGTGYTMYFNKKEERNGVLFQGRFKAIAVDSDEYLLHLSRYIHLNPLKLIQPNWIQEGIKDWDAAQKFLKEYRWSSFLDYIGYKNFPSITQRDFLQKYFKDDLNYKKFIEDFLMSGAAKSQKLILE